jgi:hypothetical protein
MTLDAMDDLALDSLAQIGRHLDKADDQTLLILRAHLLVEERLRDILRRICCSPDELHAARLSFHQVLRVCLAVLGRQDDPAWGFIARLNEVRNRISHHLEPGDLDELLGSVVSKLRPDDRPRGDTATGRFRQAVLYTCGYLDSLRGSVRLREAYASEDTV